MNKLRIITIRFTQFMLLCVIVVVLSCAPATKIDISDQGTASFHPTDLTAEVNHNSLILRWKTNRDDKLIKGYNIYLDSSNAARDTTGLQINRLTLLVGDSYSGDTDPATDFETYATSDLRDGMEYSAAVTIVYPDGSESIASNTVSFVCHPHGEFELAQRYSGENDGFSFGQAIHVPTDDFDNCIYYTMIKGQDYLLSPSRLDNVLRRVEFFDADISSIDGKVERPERMGADKIAITAGDSYLLRLDSGEYAKLIVKALRGSGDDRIVTIEYSFMPVPKLLDF